MWHHGALLPSLRRSGAGAAPAWRGRCASVARAPCRRRTDIAASQCAYNMATAASILACTQICALGLSFALHAAATIGLPLAMQQQSKAASAAA